jgi:hypothetical protein
MAGIGFHSVVANRAQMCTRDHGIPQYLDRGLPRRKLSYRRLSQSRIKFDSRLPRGYA